MFQFVILTIGLLIGVGAIFAASRRQEIMANWKQYRANPIFLFSAFLFKPDNYPKSRFDFALDNFKEVVDSLVTGLFEVVMTPIFKIFHLVSQSLQQTLSGFLGMRAIFGNMWRSLMDMVGVFMNRFAYIFHNLRVVMFKLFTSFQRIAGVATSAVFAGLSSLYSMLNFIDLVIKIIIIILIVLVVLVIFFFFILAPFIPTILIVIGIIATTVFAGSVGGMANTFCFGETTPIRTASGATVPISEIQIGDILEDGGKVTGVMKFLAPKTGMYTLSGTIVSGSHIVYTYEGPRLVSQFALATAVEYSGDYVYCLTTSTHKIKIGETQFADWEELPETEAEQAKWNQFVFETLNSENVSWVKPSEKTLFSESCISPTTRILTPNGSIQAAEICPGTVVLDKNQKPTNVTGVVQIAASQVHAVTAEGIAAGAWIWHPTSELWKQSETGLIPVSDAEQPFISVTTESGIFMTESGTAIRDFTDVGAENIGKSYDWVLDSLALFFGQH
jgi:hypothetical protein